MEVQLTADQRAFVRQAIESGRLKCEEDAVTEALSLWEERERTRAEILAAVDEANASLARGEGRPITQESMRELAERVKQAIIAAEANSSGDVPSIEVGIALFPTDSDKSQPLYAAAATALDRSRGSLLK